MKTLFLLGALLVFSSQPTEAQPLQNHFGHWGWGPGWVFNWPPIFYGYGYYPYYPTRLPTYGALAYSTDTDSLGWGWGYNTLQEAANAATTGCRADDCAPVVWVQSGCAAVATSSGGRVLGWAYADTKYEARAGAMRACHTSGLADCTARAWVCSF